MSKKTWGCRITNQTDDRVEAFTKSIDFDHRLYCQDIAASQAHARMLAEVGPIRSEDPDFVERLAISNPPFRRLLDERRREAECGKVSPLEEVRQRLETLSR